MSDFLHLKAGDPVIRVLGESVRMPLIISEVTETQIICGLWTFDRATGVEEDPELGWGVAFGKSGSRLVL